MDTNTFSIPPENADEFMRMMDDVEAGAEVLVVRNGKPVAAIIPVDRWNDIRWRID
jgi:prevent-host-death family protein